MERIPVDIPGGKPSIFDGAGEIKDIVSPEVQDRINEYETDATDVAVSGRQKLQAVDAREFLQKIRTKPLVRDYKKVGRNGPCYCGSGKKYKKCCLDSGKYEGYHEVDKAA